MTIGNTPSFLVSSTREGLRTLMIKNNLINKRGFKYSIIENEKRDEFVAWYYVEDFNKHIEIQDQLFKETIKKKPLGKPKK